MSIFGGTKSSSKSSSTNITTQQTSASTIEGVADEQISLSGQNVTYNNQFSQGVKDTLDKFIELTGESVSKTSSAFEKATAAAQAALAAVTERAETSDNPEAALLKKMLPVAMLAIVAITIYAVAGKK